MPVGPKASQQDRLRCRAGIHQCARVAFMANRIQSLDLAGKVMTADEAAALDREWLDHWDERVYRFWLSKRGAPEPWRDASVRPIGEGSRSP